MHDYDCVIYLEQTDDFEIEIEARVTILSDGPDHLIYELRDRSGEQRMDWRDRINDAQFEFLCSCARRECQDQIDEDYAHGALGQANPRAFYAKRPRIAA